MSDSSDMGHQPWMHETVTEYKSSVLTCNIAEDGCAVCEFLNGSRTVEHLMVVIAILDGQLADTEKRKKICMRELAKKLAEDATTDYSD